MIYDVRAIRLIKETSDTWSRIQTRFPHSNSYICLGHFDRIEIEQLSGVSSSECNPLKSIQEDRISLGEFSFVYTPNHSNQVYTLYLLRELHSSMDAIKQFWNDPTIYTVITQLHCIRSSNASHKDLTALHMVEQEIKNAFSSCVTKPKDSAVLQFKCPCNSQGERVCQVQCVLYDSLELSDCIAVFKSNSVTAILNGIRMLNRCGNIRDAYSYIGIPCNFMLSDYSTLTHRILNQLPSKASLGYISSRFSQKDYRKVRPLFERLQSIHSNIRPMCVTGTADYIIDWPVRSESFLLEIVWNLVHETDLLDAFHDVITRLGIPCSVPSQEASSQICTCKPEDLNSIFLPQFLSWLVFNASQQDAPSWTYSMIKLIGNLTAMHTHYSMENLTWSLLPSVSAFVSRIRAIVNTSPNKNIVQDSVFTPEQSQQIQQFIDCWTQITNDIMQIESHMTQHPELVPLRYYIPGTLLQFGSLFLIQCSNLLGDDCNQNVCSNNRKVFLPLLVPCSVESLYTVSPLDPSNETYEGSTPLIVYIPIQDLYDPTSTVYCMAHEVAHYSGNQSRNREVRYQCLCHCLAYYVCLLWYQEDKLPGERVSDENYKTFINNLYKLISEEIKQLEQTNSRSEAPYYMAHLHCHLERIGSELIMNNRYAEQFYLQVFPQYYRNITLFQRQQKIVLTSYSCTRKISLVHDRIDTWVALLKECYADLAMLYLLQCNLTDYYLSLFDREYRYLEQHYFVGLDGPDLSEPIKIHIVRLALVLYAVRSAKNQNCAVCNNFRAFSLELSQKSWYQMAEQVYSAICLFHELKVKTVDDYLKIPDPLTGSDEGKYSFTNFELEHLASYLQTCANSLNEQFSITNRSSSDFTQRLNQLRNSLSFFGQDQIEWNNIQQYLIDHMDDFHISRP